MALLYLLNEKKAEKKTVKRSTINAVSYTIIECYAIAVLSLEQEEGLMDAILIRL